MVTSEAPSTASAIPVTTGRSAGYLGASSTPSRPSPERNTAADTQSAIDGAPGGYVGRNATPVALYATLSPPMTALAPPATAATRTESRSAVT